MKYLQKLKKKFKKRLWQYTSAECHNEEAAVSLLRSEKHAFVDFHNDPTLAAKTCDRKQLPETCTVVLQYLHFDFLNDTFHIPGKVDMLEEHHHLEQ